MFVRAPAIINQFIYCLLYLTHNPSFFKEHKSIKIKKNNNEEADAPFQNVSINTEQLLKISKTLITDF